MQGAVRAVWLATQSSSNAAAGRLGHFPCGLAPYEASALSHGLPIAVLLAAPRFAHFAAVEICVSSMQQPSTVVAAHGNTGMAPGMTWQRHQQKFRWQPFKIADRVKAKPRLPAGPISTPVLHIVQLPRSPSVACDDADMRPGRVIILACHDVDKRVGEILQTAGMVKVEMRCHDVPYVR